MENLAASLKDPFASKDIPAELQGRKDAIQLALEKKAEMVDSMTEPAKLTMQAAVELLEGLDQFNNQAGMIGLLEAALNIQPRVMRGAVDID